jgi:hypothetical protein
MLRCKTDSANDVASGGPVSRVAEGNEIFGGAKTVKFEKVKSAFPRTTIVHARFLTGFVAIARKILQQGSSVDFCWFAGLDECEWKGHSLRVGLSRGTAVPSAQ